MWKPPASILGCCLAALPLIGCAGSLTALRQEGAPAPAAIATATPAAEVYATDPAAPAAILVFVPGVGAVSRDELLTRNPALWAAQGFDVVMPEQRWSDQLIADQQATLGRLLASARALADAPIWLVGPSPAIEAAMPGLGPGQVSGVVVTSVTSNAGSCSRSVFYSNLGTGAAPKVVVKTSGDACAASPPFGAGRSPSGGVPVPHILPNGPRVIEASIPADNGAPQPYVQRVAEEIKASPSS